MRGVALLPKKLGCAQEGTSAHLPPDHVSPLVDLEGQVAVGLDPLAEHVPNYCFAGGSDN